MLDRFASVQNSAVTVTGTKAPAPGGAIRTNAYWRPVINDGGVFVVCGLLAKPMGTSKVGLSLQLHLKLKLPVHADGAELELLRRKSCSLHFNRITQQDDKFFMHLLHTGKDTKGLLRALHCTYYKVGTTVISNELKEVSCQAALEPVEGLQSSFLYESQFQVSGLHLWQPDTASLLPQPITLCPPAPHRLRRVTARAAGVSGLGALAALQQLLAGGSSGGVTARLSSGPLGGPAGTRGCSTAAAAAAVSGVMKVAAVEMPAAAWNTVDVDAAASGRQVRPSATTLAVIYRKRSKILLLSSCVDSNNIQQQPSICVALPRILNFLAVLHHVA